MTNLFVHPDIAKAETISKEIYTNAELFEMIKEKTFAASWQLIGDSDQFVDSKNLIPHTILENFLDESVLLSKDKNGTIHCVSNVCTHRGKILIENSCSANGIKCGYHGRRFSLDGGFLSMPEFENVENYPSQSDHLPKIPFHQWQQFLFASVQPKQQADLFLNDMKNRIDWMPFDKLKFYSELSRDYEMKANWALYVENYLEGFHIPFVHSGLNAVIDYENYSTELFRFSNLQIGTVKGIENCFDLPESSPDFGKNIGGYYFWIFPNMMFNIYPWGISVNVVKPVKVDQTKVSFLVYVWDETKLEKGAGSNLHTVELEDEAVVESVQKGVSSRFYTHGRYSATRETGTHHFHRLIAEFLNGK